MVHACSISKMMSKNPQQSGQRARNYPFIYAMNAPFTCRYTFSKQKTRSDFIFLIKTLLHSYSPSTYQKRMGYIHLQWIHPLLNLLNVACFVIKLFSKPWSSNKSPIVFNLKTRNRTNKTQIMPFSNIWINIKIESRRNEIAHRRHSIF